MSDQNMSPAKPKQFYALIYAAFIAGLCSIIYELLIATTVSYFIGDSITYFSLTIGIYMAAMGIGSYVSKYLEENLLEKFIIAELSLAIIGGTSIPVLYFSYAYLEDSFLVIYGLFTILIGFLIGLEIPFLTRLMDDYNPLQLNIANILSFDYLGALIATIAFPFILLPYFGVYQSSLIFGFINLSIALVILIYFKDEVSSKFLLLRNLSILAIFALIVMLLSSEFLLKKWDQELYEDRIVYSEQSQYQKIVLTKHKNDLRLFLNGNLQFSASDEYRYHESLIHVPLSLKKNGGKQRILLLGAGDGLAIRELLKYDEVKEILLVDLDQKVIDLAQKNKHLKALNLNSFSSKKVHVQIGDAFHFLKKNNHKFDVIIADLPDPNHSALARLYSKQFYRLIWQNLNENGVFVTQATSPYFAKKAFWSIEKTISASEFQYVYPYHAEIPSFGNWGFVLASKSVLNINNPQLLQQFRFLNNESFKSLFAFSEDLKVKEVEVNQLDRPILLDYYLKGWQHYAQ